MTFDLELCLVLDLLSKIICWISQLIPPHNAVCPGMNSCLQDVRGRNWGNCREKKEKMIHIHTQSDYGSIWHYLWPRMLPQCILCTRVVFLTSDNWTKCDGLNGLQLCWLHAGQSRSRRMRTSVSKADSTAFHCSEGSGPRWSVEWKQTLIKDWACKQLFREAASVAQANMTWDGLNTLNVLLVSLQFTFDEASFLLSGNSNYSWMLMSAIKFSRAPNYHPAGSIQTNVQPQVWGPGFPTKACVYPTHTASLSFFIRDPNLFPVEADIFRLLTLTIISPQT